MNADGKIAIKDARKDDRWIRLFTHYLEEFALRKQGVSNKILALGRVDWKRYVSVPRAAQAWERVGQMRRPYLLKFGRKKHLRPMLNTGTLRIAPASYYRNESHSPSIRDEELEFVNVMYGATVSAPPNKDYSIPRANWVPIPIIGNVKSISRSGSDYYVCCFSSAHAPRLYDDFGADSCLVVQDVDRFRHSIGSRMSEVVPQWEFCYGPVAYIDPYGRRLPSDVCFTKHFRYSYQNEYRFVWRPVKPLEDLRPIYLELGPLKDYCSLVEI